MKIKQIPCGEEPMVLDDGPRWMPGKIVMSLETAKFVHTIDRKMDNGYGSFLVPEVERREGSAIEGRGLFALEDIEELRLVAIKGGRLVNGAEVGRLTAEGKVHGSAQQIGQNEFLIGLTPEEEEENLVGYNHSCDPNAFIMIPPDRPVAFLVTKRPIAAGEEITVDYGAFSQSKYLSIEECKCGAPNCRGTIDTRMDWLREDVRSNHQNDQGIPMIPKHLQDQIDLYSQLPPEGRVEIKDAYKKMFYTADWVNMLATRLELLRALRTSPRGRAVAKMAVKALGNDVGEKATEAQLEHASRDFARVCIFKNIEIDCGIDRSSEESLRKTLSGNYESVIAFARTVSEI